MSNMWERKLFEMAGKEQIIVPDSLNQKLHRQLLSIEKQGTGRKRKKRAFGLKRAVILAAALTMLFSVTVTAAVSAWKQRMESMNGEKLEEYFAQIYTSKLPADNYNRPFTESENIRMEALAADYEAKGRFPEGELVMLDTAEDYKGKNVGFLKGTSTFFFPEKEMSDEELLQVIDFRYKRDYSLQKMNEMIAAGEAEPVQPEPVMPEETTPVLGESDQKLTIAYTGELSISSMAAGNDCIFLFGQNTVHRMELGSGDSAVFFDDFDKKTSVSAMCQDKDGQVYLGLVEQQEDGSWENGLWVLDQDGNFLKKIDLAPFRSDTVFHVGSPDGPESTGQIWNMAVDEEGFLYLRGSGFQDAAIMLILDQDGKLVSRIDQGDYYTGPVSGMGVGRDKKVYTALFDRENRLGIASINPREGTLEEVYMGIVPEDTISFDVVTRGSDADFVIWGYSGIFSYNIGEEQAELVMPAWETPCNVEGALRCGLPDGRILLAASTEYRRVTDEYGMERGERIPEKTFFYYLPGTAAGAGK